ncbi:MAG TPA: hypothetical protein VHA79_03055 [Mycobacteriales bacterium]|nr:hypothetical protein [Mycobacteriales bacterium]
MTAQASAALNKVVDDGSGRGTKENSPTMLTRLVRAGGPGK